jgi:DNA gyrase inhibitor GyrI
MDKVSKARLDVSIQDLSPVRVIRRVVVVDQAGETFDEQIRRGFQEVFSWASQNRVNITRLLCIGVPYLDQKRLTSYWCCLQVPEAEPYDGKGLEFGELPGGRFAVLNIPKDPESISAAIARFYSDYAPQSQLALDETRPSYEIYYEHTMQFCVPLQEVT